MQLNEFYAQVCDQPRGVFQARFASDSLRYALITALKKQFMVKVFDEVPSPHALGAGSLFKRTIFVAPYDKKLAKAVLGGTLILVVNRGSRKEIIDIDLPPVESFKPAIVQRLTQLGVTVSDPVFAEVARIAKNDPAEIKTIFSLISTYLVGTGGGEITRELVHFFFPQSVEIKPFTLFNYLLEPPANHQLIWNEVDENLKRFGAALPMVAALITMATKKYYAVLGTEAGVSLKRIEEVAGLKNLSDRYVTQDMANLPRICRLLLQLTLIRYEIIGRFYDPDITLKSRLLEYISKDTQVSPSLI